MRAVLLLVCVATLGCGGRVDDTPPTRIDPKVIYRELFAELQPVKLTNCEFERVGDANDGGYVICRNLLDRAQALYSYGISASDQWGCTLSARLKLPVHQYDCFNLDRPACGGAAPIFHEECVGPAKVTTEGRLFDTVEAQIGRNGDAGNRLIVKMDVEGSEWPSLLGMPDAVLGQIDQLSVEFHGVDKPSYVEVIRKLKTTFHVVNVHYNNWTCHPEVAPLPAFAFEVLFVNKNLGAADPAGAAIVPNPLDAPNNWERPDCQAAAATTESKSPR